MEELMDYLLQFGSLNKEQIDLIKKKATEIELGKDDFFWEAGKVVRQIGFVVSGVLRVYYYNNKGDEITRYFVDENHLILNGHDTDTNFVPAEYLQAITPCKLVVFSEQGWKALLETIMDWEKMLQKIMTKNHGEKIARRSELVSQDATTRYLEFIEKFPTLVNRVPLSYIASYLGITQSSLSRIRKNIH
ncbi:Crp/Fnr family transcriptional regulator [Parapedobacter sp. DT-150]|uniref:Crp/Fnr family transcriptional regulator n=1 Tax=Parapedobacter sp. DT-150 TaxID=3396162 RepID=UPI003F1B66A0